MIAPAWIIEKKRDGLELNEKEINSFIEGVLSGEFADYQTAAFLMAVYFKGLTLNETVYLTEAMVKNGESYNLHEINGPKVDKHSTGGVGDKVSLVLGPLAASCGLNVPMMSGRGLGHTGGTLDKLESISGFNVSLTAEEFKEALRQVGCAMIGQSDSIVPADKKLYSLRDVTGTVESIPLITASILSKKLAEGSEFLVLDIKTGNGAFMKSLGQARKLADSLVKVARRLKLPTRAVLTDMNQPLGYTVGNLIEVIEATEVLKRVKPGVSNSNDLKELTLSLCSHMLDLSKRARNLSQARKIANKNLMEGCAWEHFEKMVAQQGGQISSIPAMREFMDSAVADSSDLQTPRQLRSVTWRSRKKGYLCRINTQAIGQLLIMLGGGRKKVDDQIQSKAGIIFHKKLGSKTGLNEPLVSIFFESDTEILSLEDQFHDSIEIAEMRKPVPKLVVGWLET